MRWAEGPPPEKAKSILDVKLGRSPNFTYWTMGEAHRPNNQLSQLAAGAASRPADSWLVIITKIGRSPIFFRQKHTARLRLAYGKIQKHVRSRFVTKSMQKADIVRLKSLPGLLLKIRRPEVQLCYRT